MDSPNLTGSKNGHISSWQKWTKLDKSSHFWHLINKVKVICILTALLIFWKFRPNTFFISSLLVGYLCTQSHQKHRVKADASLDEQVSCLSSTKSIWRLIYKVKSQLLSFSALNSWQAFAHIHLNSESN